MQDHYDVKMPCHLLLMKLAGKAGSQVLGSLDSLTKPLEKTLTAKLKSDAVKQEVSQTAPILYQHELQTRSRCPAGTEKPGLYDAFTAP